MQERVEFPGGKPAPRGKCIAEATGKLVECNGHLYLFGGIEVVEDGQDEPSNALIKLTPRFTGGGNFAICGEFVKAGDALECGISDVFVRRACNDFSDSNRMWASRKFAMCKDACVHFM